MKDRRYRNMKLPVTVLLAVLLLFATVLANAGEPTDQVRQTVDQVLNVLRNQELKKKSHTAERRAALRRIIMGRFDFEEMAKRSMGMHWRNLTPEQRKEFTALFTDLLERSYLNKIESYEDESIVYTGERVDGTFAEVKTQIITKRKTQIPIDYRLKKEGNQWYAYDVIIEGVSLVNNYRTQFNTIIRRESYEALVKRMKAKREEEEFITSGVKTNH